MHLRVAIVDWTFPGRRVGQSIQYLTSFSLQNPCRLQGAYAAN